MSNQRLSISSIIFFGLTFLLALYFAFAAVQGPSGILRRVQIEAEIQTLGDQRDRLRAEVADMQNLTRRLSDDYLDIDLLDEQARKVLGVIRGDEVVIR